MADKTRIEWTDATWNPVTGCTKVSAGCKHCYAERDWARLAANPQTRYYGRAFTDVQCHPDVLALPLRWTKPRRIFVNSMSDLFHPGVSIQFHKTDNRYSNLELLTRGDHNSLHIAERGRRSNGQFEKAAGRLLDGIQHDGYPETTP